MAVMAIMAAVDSHVWQHRGYFWYMVVSLQIEISDLVD